MTRLVFCAIISLSIMEKTTDSEQTDFKVGAVDFEQQIADLERPHVNTDPSPAPPALPPDREVDKATSIGRESENNNGGDDEKVKLRVISFICAVLGVIVAGGICGSLVAVVQLSDVGSAAAKKPVVAEEQKEESVMPELPVKTEEEPKDEQMFIGSPDLGYLKVETYWRQISMTDSAVKNRALYENGNYYITIVDEGVATKDISVVAEEWRNVITSEGAESVELSTITFGDSTAQLLKGYYRSQNIWTMSWLFKTNDGHLRYITVEGPNKTNKYFAIPNTYSLTK